MPVISPAGQPGASRDWFASPPGRAVLDSEAALVRRRLAERPAPPWLWLAPVSQPVFDGDRGLCLSALDGGWEGGVRCRLPLPFAGQSLGTVVLQHVLAPHRQADALLAECERVLVPGGRLHLFALNPLSPYRWRWRGVGLQASEPLTWRRKLRQAGLEPEPVSQGVGPGWRVEVRERTRSGPGLCAAYVLCAEKREAPLTPVPRKARLRLQQGLPAA